jgi:hypothetical protein
MSDALAGKRRAAPSYSRTYLLTQLKAAATTKTIEKPLLALEIR